MKQEENPKYTPKEYKDSLKKQLKALRKIRKIYRKEVLAGSLLYHTSLRNVNKQIAEVYDELIILEQENPELNKTILQRFTESLEDLAKAAANATQNH